LLPKCILSIYTSVRNYRVLCSLLQKYSRSWRRVQPNVSWNCLATACAKWLAMCKFPSIVRWSRAVIAPANDKAVADLYCCVVHNRVLGLKPLDMETAFIAANFDDGGAVTELKRRHVVDGLLRFELMELLIRVSISKFLLSKVRNKRKENGNGTLLVEEYFHCRSELSPPLLFGTGWHRHS